MKAKLFSKSPKDILIAVAPVTALISILLIVLYYNANPAPPSKLVLSTGDNEGEYSQYAALYQETFKDEGVKLEARSSSGALENYNRLKDPKSDVDVGFVQDGLGSPEDAPDLVSLGSLYYEPIWVFYRNAIDHGAKPLDRFSQLAGKKIAVGIPNGGTRILSLQILKASGVTKDNSSFIEIGWKEAAASLKTGSVDAAIFLATAEDEVVRDLLQNSSVTLMSVDQAEAITRQIPFLHHLVLPHGAINLQKNIPNRDIDLVSATATLLVKDSVHPALVYLLLKAASSVHSDPGLFEKKNEFPIDKDDRFPLSDEAKSYYKSGEPFWQKHLPFWIATLMDRFLLLFIPLLAIALPVIRLIPKIYQWRIRARIYKRYGELKFLETSISNSRTHDQDQTYLHELDQIEERVKQMKVPIGFAEHLYSLRGHIDFVRAQISEPKSPSPNPRI